MIAKSLNLEPSMAGLLTSAVLFPLGLMPVVYGIFLGSRQISHVMAFFCVIYAASFLPVLAGGDYLFILCGRVFQGLSLPGILVCAMTYIGTRYHDEELQKYMSYYAVFVIFGSFLGRLMAGALETATGHWRYAFFAPFMLICGTLPLCLLLQKSVVNRLTFGFRALLALFKQKHMFALLCITPLLCFASGAVMNVLPFRLKELSPDMSSFQISVIYSGILVCSLIGFAAPGFLRHYSREMRVIFGAICVFLFFYPFLLSPRLDIFVCAFIGYNLGMAFIYTSMPGIINRFSKGEKSVANGVYLTCYYVFNSAGSYFPLLVYENMGFTAFLSVMLAIASVAFFIAFFLRNIQM